MPKKQSVRNIDSDDLIEQLDPDTRITDVGADPVIEEPMGAGDPAVKAGTVDEKQDNPAPPELRQKRDYGLLGE